MRTRKFSNFLLLSLAFLIFSFVGVNAQNYGGASSDRNIEQKVFKRINGLPRYEVFDFIAFKVDGGTVTLYGKVYNAINKSSAENAVEDIAGVTNVVNNIEVLPPSPFDDQIRRQLLYEFARTGGLYRYFNGVNPSVRIIVERGRVALEGFVANRADANLLNIRANGVFGVFGVQNNVVISNRAG